MLLLESTERGTQRCVDFSAGFGHGSWKWSYDVQLARDVLINLIIGLLLGAWFNRMEWDSCTRIHSMLTRPFVAAVFDWQSNRREWPKGKNPQQGSRKDGSCREPKKPGGAEE